MANNPDPVLAAAVALGNAADAGDEETVNNIAGAAKGDASAWDRMGGGT